MRSFTQKQNQPQQRASFNKTGSGTVASAESHQVHPILNLQRTIGNQAVQRMLQPHAEKLEVGSTSTAVSRFAHDFSRILVHAPVTGAIQTKLNVNIPGDIYEQEADTVAEQVMSMATPLASQVQRQTAEEKLIQRKIIGDVQVQTAPPIVHEVLRSPGQPLDIATRAFMEPRFGCDFSRVRVHADSRADEQAAASAAKMRAQAYTVGSHIVFGVGRYQPATSAGQRLIAHELAHVVQQRHSVARPPNGSVRMDADTAAEAAAEAASGTSRAAHGHGLSVATQTAIQRKVEMRDVGSGDQSGFSRLPELIDRLNAMAQGLTLSITAGGPAAHRVRDYEGNLVQGNQTVELQYTAQPEKTPSLFEARMMALIDQAAVLPLRLTNRHGLLGTPATGFHSQVDVDAWQSGYVDIDDLLASSDLGLQSVLLHFLTERSATANYSHRIGTATFTDPEFQRVHGLGIEAEAQLLQDFFGDPTIHIVNDSPSPTVRRVFRNARGDLIRRMITRGTGAQTGVDASSIDVITHDGRHMTADEYRRLLEEERIRDQTARERLRGVGEHREGGRLIPAP